MSSLFSLSNTFRLQEAYADKFLLGTTLSIRDLRHDDSASVAIAQHHFGAFTAENSMKPAIIQPVPNQFYWKEADRLVELAQECGATPIGHTLVWHAQTPRWFFETPEGKPLSRELALANMRSHIAQVAGRYKGRVKQWDVVNEAISDEPGEELRPSPWLKAVGEEFIAQAFHAAHEADPDAVLIYNDYNIELGEKRGKTLRLLKKLIADGVPIHAVGIQGHWHLNYPDLDEIECAIEQFAALGLRVMITELDLGVLPNKYQGADITVRQQLQPELNPYTQGLPDYIADQQAERYEGIFRLFSRYHSVIDRVTFWGVHDGDSWLNNFPVPGRTDYPLPFDREGNPKPAFHALRKAAQDISAPEAMPETIAA